MWVDQQALLSEESIQSLKHFKIKVRKPKNTNIKPRVA